MIKISTFYTQIDSRLLIENFYKFNELRADVNLGILSHPTQTTLQLKRLTSH